MLAKYRVGRNPLRQAQIVALDWPVLGVHLLLRREAAPIRERLRARARGLRSADGPPPLELATVGFAEALGRQAQQLRLRLTGGLPAHFSDGARAPRADTPETRRSDSG